MVAVHLGLGGAALADTRWTAGTVGLVAAAVAVKLTLLGGFTVRRRGRRTGES
ncbi:hypothetical protein H9Y04_11600 [Streptomyces sp. TRM66268-LWL]|uniref:Uncharacterized protein n=1 Tax=Streptomyces polyasparticus TaxID=2767826 RepID=A0ABR7SEA9_9ACTN|nr:hypothetical protein [Streptomyces polyasparticus]MBC9713214.1 hypothetical protein [Streptomyces polyasparticus]